MTAAVPPPPPHALGAGDCERWRPRGLGQPTNAATAGAYLVSAAWLLHRSRAVTPAQRWRVRTAAAVSAATGVGSIAYHGVGGRLAHVLHDTSLLALLAWSPVGSPRPAGAADGSAERDVAPADAAAAARADVTRRRVAAASAAVGLTAYLLGRTGSPACRPTSRWQWHGLWHVAGAVATAAWADAVDVLPHVADGRC